jgi:transposase-like protein
VADVCRQLGVSEASFYLWKKKYAKLGLTEIRERRQNPLSPGRKQGPGSDYACSPTCNSADL